MNVWEEKGIRLKDYPFVDMDFFVIASILYYTDIAIGYIMISVVITYPKPIIYLPQQQAYIVFTFLSIFAEGQRNCQNVPDPVYRSVETEVNNL